MYLDNEQNSIIKYNETFNIRHNYKLHIHTLRTHITHEL